MRCWARSAFRPGGSIATASSGGPRVGPFSVTKPIDGKAATPANGGTIGFAAASAAEVDAFHSTGLALGAATCEDPPGIREGGSVKLHIAYLRDPDGNKLCAVHRVA